MRTIRHTMDESRQSANVLVSIIRIMRNVMRLPLTKRAWLESETESEKTVHIKQNNLMESLNYSMECDIFNQLYNFKVIG